MQAVHACQPHMARPLLHACLLEREDAADELMAPVTVVPTLLLAMAAVGVVPSIGCISSSGIQHGFPTD